jgi:transcription termination/antitermination protein NusG
MAETVKEIKKVKKNESHIKIAEPSKGARWYVVHTYSGHENKVATTLEQRAEALGLTHKIFEILVPTQEKIMISDGKKRTVDERIFPGYIIVNMEMEDNAWYAVRGTQGVTGFVGIGDKPTPISKKEVESIMQFMQAGATTFEAEYREGDGVKVVDGPFKEFLGKVEAVDNEKGVVTVLISVFGRETPVELDFAQVEPV